MSKPYLFLGLWPVEKRGWEENKMSKAETKSYTIRTDTESESEIWMYRHLLTRERERERGKELDLAAAKSNS